MSPEDCNYKLENTSFTFFAQIIETQRIASLGFLTGYIVV